MKHIRKSRNITQDDIANYLKIDRSTYAYYETGKTVPSIYTIQKIADFYGVTISDLLFDEIS